MADEETPKGEQETFTKADVDRMVEEATSGLSKKVDELLGETKAAKAKAREEAEARAKAAEEAARKSGDTEALEKSWQEKLAKIEAEKGEELSTYKQMVERLTIGQTATSIAAEIAVQGSASVLEKLIQPRLGYEVRDGSAHIVVKDASGKPSALTVDELKQEISSDPAFAPLIAASKASGGGAANANGGAGSQPKGNMGGSKQERLAAIGARLRANGDK